MAKTENDIRYSATASARHSSKEELTVPPTEGQVWPGLYQDDLTLVKIQSILQRTPLHRLLGQGINDTLVRVAVSKPSQGLSDKSTFSKLSTPFSSSVKSFPEPWPSSSWLAT
jgi:hypothetical protein